MRFVVTHPIISHPCNGELVSAAGVAAVATAAEKAGFDGIGFTDHPAPSQRWLDAGGHDSLDPFAAIGFAAAHTTHLKLIPNVIVLPYRNPFIVAKAASTLDLLSEGRFILAVGLGYLRSEFAALGVEFAERAELFDESLDAIRAIWTGDDVAFQGKHFTARGVTAHPRPISKPHPPIWIGGNTGSARRRVVTRGDGWVPFAAPAQLATAAGTSVIDSIAALSAGVDDLRRRCDASGRDAATIDISFTNLGGGRPGDNDFNADQYLEGIAELAVVGVTSVNVPLPGDSLVHTLDAIERFGDSVIANHEPRQAIAWR